MTQQPPALAETAVALAPAATVDAIPNDKENKKDKDKDKQKKDARQRASETMFRVTYQNHIALSRLADSKASMLISINGLIISGMIAIVTRTGAVSWNFAPMLVLIAGCLVSLAFAVFSARPRLNRSKVTLDDVRANTGNLLFFGQFTSMPLEEFQESLRVLTKDPKLLYDHLARQLYMMGQSLDAKYRYLQIAYTAFLSGVGAAASLFAALYLAGGFSA